MAADFLAKLGGPSMDLTELGLRPLADLAVEELAAIVFAAGMKAPSDCGRPGLEELARVALSRQSAMRRGGSEQSVGSQGSDGVVPPPDEAPADLTPEEAAALEANAHTPGRRGDGSRLETDWHGQDWSAGARGCPPPPPPGRPAERSTQPTRLLGPRPRPA